MLRTFFIICYVQKILMFLNMIDFRSFVEHFMIQQKNFQNLIIFSQFQNTSKNDVVVKKTKKKTIQSFWWCREI